MMVGENDAATAHDAPRASGAKFYYGILKRRLVGIREIAGSHKFQPIEPLDD